MNFALHRTKEKNNKTLNVLKKQLNKLRVQLNGIKKMDAIPDIMIVIDQNYEWYI